MKRDAIFYSSIIMAFSAGFVDTSTFTVADGLFSAHITGNFVVFAYKLSNHPAMSDFINLVSFPVFILAVILTRKVDSWYKNERGIFAWIGIYLIIAGILAFFLKQNHITTGFVYHFMLMLIVFSMGIQNTVNRLYANSAFGPTTVMTGNVTKAILDFFSYISTQHTFEKLIELKKSLVLLTNFLIGCILGALISSRFGLVSMLIPGILITVYYTVFSRKISLSF
ncbi:YoaK family protein [Chryseobacterium sp. SIMBA_038]|uniref:YoaK family protein n=1 Tax=Chryseobacterium sp. SIMBA_038 TaxID=3085780 RepID=UPI003977F781